MSKHETVISKVSPERLQEGRILVVAWYRHTDGELYECANDYYTDSITSDKPWYSACGEENSIGKFTNLSEVGETIKESFQKEFREE